MINLARKGCMVSCRLKWTIVFAWLLLGCYAVVAQPLPFDHITIADGLSNNTVYCISQDVDGFMWVGTRDGLNRFDGYEFKVFKAVWDERPGLPSNNIQALYNHPNGDIWIGMRRGGIVVFDRETQAFQRLDVGIDSIQQLQEVAVQAFFEDTKGNIWVGTAGLGVLKLDAQGRFLAQFATFHPDSRKRLNTDHCFSFAEDSTGNIWFGTDGNVIPYLDNASGEVRLVRHPGSPGIYSYRKTLRVKGDSLIIGTEGNGVFIYHIPSHMFITHRLKEKLVRDLNLLPDNRLFISTDGDGLFVYDLNLDTLTNYRYAASQRNSLNTNAIYDIFTDRDGNIWLGTFNGGLNVLKSRGAPFYSYLPGTQAFHSSGAFSVLTFFEEDDGTVLVGMDGAGIWQFSPSDRRSLMIPFLQAGGDTKGQVVTSLFRDSRGELWIGSFAHGLTRIGSDGSLQQTYTYEPGSENGLTNNNIWDITEDQEGTIWIAALGGGVMQFDRETNAFSRFVPEPDNPRSLSDWNARVIFIDSRNRVWIGTEDGGLNLFHRNTRDFTSWMHEHEDSSGLQSNSVLCIFEDSAGRIWIGTEGGGLHCFQKDLNTFSHYSLKDGFQSNVINAIEQDASGRLWLSTNDGITSFDPVSGDVNNFDSNDGLSSDQFNPDASIHTLGGEIIFGNIRGANGFDPDMITINKNPPGVVFTNFQLFNNSVNIGSYRGRKILDRPLNEQPTISLQYRDNVFSIVFAAIEYTNPLKNAFAYRMLGFEEEWNYVSAATRRATYTNLDPGEYTFEVKASNNNGVWSDEVRRLHLVIAPPFYATWWFRLLVACLVLLILAGLIKLRDLRRKEKHKQELLVAEQQILQLRNKNLREEVKRKNAELSAALLQSAHKNKALDGLKHQLAELTGGNGFENEKRLELKKLIRKIESEIGSSDYWERFQINFNQIHQQFAEKIHTRHPNLTQNDIRLCCLIKINLTNREIATIQNISIAGVEKSKFRLKRKVGLEQEQDLNQYIHSLS